MMGDVVSRVRSVARDLEKRELVRVGSAEAAALRRSPEHQAAELLRTAADEIARLRAEVPQLRSEAIREFCERGGIRPTWEALNLPDDVRAYRLASAITAKDR